jgi:hypothetical protein
MSSRTRNGSRSDDNPPPESRIAAQVIFAGPQDYRVLAVPSRAARSGRSHVAIRIDRLLVYIEDREALESCVLAWGRAIELAERLFPPTEPTRLVAERRRLILPPT